MPHHNTVYLPTMLGKASLDVADLNWLLHQSAGILIPSAFCVSTFPSMVFIALALCSM